MFSVEFLDSLMDNNWMMFSVDQYNWITLSVKETIV